MHSQAIELLYGEHNIILAAIQRTEKILNLPEFGKEGSRLLAMINFFREYGDEYHHRKEEDILFGILSGKNEFLKEGIIGSLEGHHENFRDELREISELVQGNRMKEAKAKFTGYLSDLKDHISAENDELFVVAEEMLSEEEKKTLYFNFLDKDRELGEERKKEMEMSLESV